MSLYDNASLVMIPSGVKEDKLYSVKPTDGSGDFTFSRGSDIQATRVNSSGLIEKAKENEVKYSQEYGGSGTANWANVGTATITTDNTTAPDGTSTADKIAKASGSTSGVYQILSVSSGIVYTQSIYVKNDSNCDDMLLGCDLNPANANLRFNPQTGAISSVGAGVIDSSATDVGSGWYRVSITYQTTSTTNTFLIYNLSSVASSFFAWGAQLNHGLIAQDYVETTTTAVVEGLTADLPRLDYSGGASCPSLLLEPSRTNLIDQSENATAWSKSNLNATTNYGTSPEGVSNSVLIESNSTSGGHYFGAGNMSITSGTTYVGSIFVKQGTARYFQLLFGGSAFGSESYANFDLQEGSVTKEGTNIDAQIEPYGNNWYRVSIVGPANATDVESIYACVITSATAARVQSHTSVLNNEVYGVQVEVGSYPTSYIPTYGTAANRGADSCSKTGISSLIGQTEGTLFAEFDVQSLDGVSADAYINISDGTSNNIIYIAYFGNGRVQAVAIIGGAIQVNINLTSYGLTEGVHKFAFAYNNNDYNFFVDGVSVGTDTSASVPTTSAFNLVTRASGGPILNYKQTLLFKTRLTNAELAALTT